LPESSLTAVDLFSGAGGATEGLRQAGIVTVAAVENDRDAARTYSLNHPNATMFESDIRDLNASEVCSDTGLRRGQLTLLKACPPCQGFSSLGSEDDGDPRNDLILEVWKFLREFFPKAFVLENVPGIKSDSRLLRLTRQSRAIGYHVKTFEVDAADLGVPQRRRRLVVVGVRGVRASRRLMETTEICSKRRQLSSGPVLEMVSRSTSQEDPLNRSRSSSYKTLERIRAIPIGGNRFDLPDHLVLACHAKMKTRNATGPYGRISADYPSPTMTTRCTTPSCGTFIHPTEDRGLTLREAAALQTFPMNYQFVGNYGSIERQIGNAVPVKMAFELGKAIRSLVR
jgi:DNA (cytosine-5)-methyltransferase 1